MTIVVPVLGSRWNAALQNPAAPRVTVAIAIITVQTYVQPVSQPNRGPMSLPAHW